MPTINYEAVFTFLDRVDPVVLDMPEDKVAVEDAVADLKLAFVDWTPLQSVPITLVLDKQGRVAARFIGQIESGSILRTVVDDVLAETS